jgi:hypothetical protein
MALDNPAQTGDPRGALASPNKGVRTKHPDYEKYLPDWQKIDAVIAGQRAVHAMADTLLPMLKDEDAQDYKSRVLRSDFYNATWRTVSGLTGMAFRIEPQSTLPAAIEKLVDDINLAGQSLNEMAKELVGEVLSLGRMGILVDYPPAPANVTGMTLADAERLGRRPTIQIYNAKSTINWRFGRVQNAWVLTMVVLQEETEVSGGDEFSHKTEPRYRVLDLDDRGFYRQRVFRINERDEDELVDEVYPLMNGNALTNIPFMFVGAGGKGDAIDDPPLIDLVDANVAHYQVNSDYRHGLHFTGLPTAVITGFRPDDPSGNLYVGSMAAWTFKDTGAKAYYLEFTGEGLGSLEKALTGLELRMAMLGARMLADETQQAETLGATQIKHEGENSVLAGVVQAVSNAMEWALKLFTQWSGVSAVDTIEYHINEEFLPTAMTFQELTAQVQAWQAGAISDVELFENLQRGGIIDSQKPFDQHQEETKTQLARMPAPVKPVGAPPPNPVAPPAKAA